MKDPNSPLHLLAGSEESMGIVSRILLLDAEEWGIVPCRHCANSPAVFCCHRRKGLPQECVHPDEAAAASTCVKEDVKECKKER